MRFKSVDRRLEGKTVLRQCQLTQLYLLDVVVEICEKYDIPYFLDFGSLIGALRHNGFIPWDDDLDIGMLYDDYLRFLKVAERELPENLTLLTPTNYGWHNEPIARVVDRSSFFCFPYTQIAIPCGIFIDITPYVKCPHLPARVNRCLAYALRMSWHAVAVHRGCLHSNIAGIFLSGVKACVWKVIFLLLKAVEKVFTRFGKTTWWEMPENGSLSPHGVLKEDIFPLRKHCFEGKEYNIPRRAEDILSEYYGDWRTPPPDAAKGLHHTVGIICPTQPPVADWARPYKGKSDFTVAQEWRG